MQAQSTPDFAYGCTGQPGPVRGSKVSPGRGAKSSQSARTRDRGGQGTYLPHLFQPAAEFRRHLAVARQAKCSQVFKIALPSTLCHRKHVVRVPQGPPCPDRPQAPHLQSLRASLAATALQLPVSSNGVGAAQGAASTITGKDLFAQVPRIGA